MPYLRRALSPVLFASALVLVALALPSTAFGQATRTWVSGVGDDANPCSRTAPCKTFAGAISKTANGGEINCLDPGGFGGVTITKSLTIKCHYTEGGVLVSGTNAIVINALATDKITLRGLDIKGIGTGAQTSLVGVKVLSAGSVHLIDNEIYRFKAGVAVVPTNGISRVYARGNHIHDNGVGFITAPGNNTITAAVATLRDNDIVENKCGVVASAFGTNASTPDAAVDCGAAGAGSGINRTTVVSAYRNGIHDSNGAGLSAGVLSRGASATVEIGLNEITGNGFGLRRLDSGVIKSFQNNIVSNNSASDAPSATAGATRNGVKKKPKKGRV
jgi:hypothetical protein